MDKLHLRVKCNAALSLHCRVLVGSVLMVLQTGKLMRPDVLFFSRPSGGRGIGIQMGYVQGFCCWNRFQEHASRSSNQKTHWWTPVVMDAIKLRKVAFRTWLSRRSHKAADRYSMAKMMATSVVMDKKNLRHGKKLGGHGEGLFVGLDAVLANHLVTQKSGLHPRLCLVWVWNCWPGPLIHRAYAPLGRQIQRTFGEDVSITLAEVTVVAKGFLVLGHNGWMTFSLRYSRLWMLWGSRCWLINVT